MATPRIVLVWLAACCVVATAQDEVAIDRPGAPNGWCVVLFGGGYEHDADWTVPGEVEHEGERLPLTIDGEATRDARTIAAALTDAGFTVARCAIGRDENGGVRGFEQGLAVARSQWAEALERMETTSGRTIVVGHSLGATRGVLASDGEAAGYVLLAGAYMSPTATSPRKLASDALAEWGGRALGERAYRARAEVQGRLMDFGFVDADASGAVTGWELAALKRLEEVITPERAEFRPSVPWASHLLIAGKRPTLAIWGGLDDTSVHGPLLAALAERMGDAPIECVYEAQLGHQLSAVEGKLVGPIDKGVVAQIVGFSRKIATDLQTD